jgi:hypothetical protein
MIWNPSRYRTGDLVEVRSKEQILATLDEQGSLDGLPFMPEMFQFCGKRFRVRAVAHKTCETARQTWKGRRLRAAVHLDDLRCDGSAHGGCEAACTLFWKDSWLKPVVHDATAISANGKPHALVCSEDLLELNTRLEAHSDGEEICYACQATRLYDATGPLAWWDLRHYWLDVVTGNHSAKRVLKVIWLASLRNLWRVIRYVPLVRNAYVGFNNWMHCRLTGRSAPYPFKSEKPLARTPTGRLDLKPGELVRVKSKSEIEETLDAKGMNRGLWFDPEEMAPHCGGTYRVRSCVTRIIDEMTGKMRHMKQPCIILEGVVCQGEYARCRLNCPRAIPSYWRELWLERVSVDEPSARNGFQHAAAPASLVR